MNKTLAIIKMVQIENAFIHLNVLKHKVQDYEKDFLEFLLVEQDKHQERDIDTLMQYICGETLEEQLIKVLQARQERQAL